MKQKKPLQLMIQDQSRLDQLLKDHMSRTSKIQFREVSVVNTSLRIQRK